jgi:hypothetical protein
VANESRNYRGRPVQGAPGPLKSLASQNTVGAGSDFRLPHAFKEFSVAHFRRTTSATGASTAITIRLQGSIADSSKWVTVGATPITCNSTSLVVVRSTNAIAFDRVRLNLLAMTTKAGSTHLDKNNITAWIVIPPAA